nr:sugar-binding domain-containing protein [uncultured Caproiciproducens sp.]
MDARIDLLVYIAELYYQQGLSQQRISKMTNMSRPTISRLLNEAKETGVVEIVVHSPILKNPQLSYAIRTTFGLRDAIVIAGTYDYDKALHRSAEAAANFLNTVLENNQTLGISWGKPLQYLCDAMKPTNYYNLNVVQMAGCLGTGNPHFDGLELALEISKKLDGTYSNIYAPVYVDSELVYSYLIAEPQIETTLKRALTTDVIVTGIGSLQDPESTLEKAGYYNDKQRMELLSRGGVGHLLARMFDKDGNELNIPGRYTITAPLSAMQHAQWSIGISASAMKAEAVLGAIHGKYLNMLVIDETLAYRMLELAGAKADYLTSENP